MAYKNDVENESRTVFRDREKKPSKFTIITPKVINNDEKLATFLLNSNIKSGKQGGSFVGNYDIAPPELKKYGIILPNGGMILPDYTPENLKKIIEQAKEVMEKTSIQEQNIQNEKEDKYFQDIFRLLEKYSIPELTIFTCFETTQISFNLPKHKDAKTFLAFGHDEAFCISRKVNIGESDCHADYEPLANIEAFLKAESQIYDTRKKLMPRIRMAAEKITQINLHPALEREKQLYFTAISYEAKQKQQMQSYQAGLSSAHQFCFLGKKYDISEQGINDLEKDIDSAELALQIHFDNIWKLFQNAQGVFTMESTITHGHDKTGGGRIIPAVYINKTYFVYGKLISPNEYRWLKSRTSEVQIPPGFYRINNETNETKPVIYPHNNDELEVWGYKNEWQQRRRQPEILYKGRPESCPYYLGQYSIAGWKINGETVDTRCLSKDYFQTWNDPARRAKRALIQAGVAIPKQAEIEALTKAYITLETNE